MKLPENIELSGPYYKFSKPYGTFVTCQRDEWYVSKKLTEQEKEIATPISKIFGKTCLGNIVKFREQKVYVISQLYPRVEFKTLRGAVMFLIRNERKLVFCS